jgi:cytochrome c5
MKTLLKAVLFASTTLVSGLSLVHAEATAVDPLKLRIAPVGNVCVEGQECVTAAVEAVAAAGGAMSVEDIYKNNCQMCHGGALPNAPKFADAAAWAPRIEQGMEALYSNAINGLNGEMPAMGNCSSCDDDDIKAVVDYFVENAQ